MSSYETIQRKRNITVGIFVVVATVAIIWLIFMFGDLPVFVSDWKSYQVSIQFPTASGVQENTPVRFCGYQIGRVKRVTPPQILRDLNTDKFYHQAVVIVNIDSGYNKIPANVEAKLMTRGLGSSYIEFIAPSFDVTDPNVKYLSMNSSLQGRTGVASEFFPESSQKKLDELMDRFTILIDSANKIIGDAENRENIKAALASLAKAADKSIETVEQLRVLAARGTESLKTVDSEMQDVGSSLVAATEELSQAAMQLRTMLEKLNSGQGSAGRLLNDGQMYENLLENTEQMQLLLEELTRFAAQARQKGVPIKLK